ncbi:MAG: hypothetical protein ACP5I1_06365 [Candidatus Hinthialibacter sp.]
MKPVQFFILIWVIFSGVQVLAQTEERLRASLIEASTSETFWVDAKLRSLEKPLKNLRSDDEEMQEILQEFRRFKPLWITPAQPIRFGETNRLTLNREKTLFVDLTLHPLQEDYYPASVRWYVKEGKTEKDILKIEKLKFYKDRRLFLFDGGLTKFKSKFNLLALEWVKPEEESQAEGSEK